MGLKLIEALHLIEMIIIYHFNPLRGMFPHLFEYC
jgi:hypothetical protein